MAKQDLTPCSHGKTRPDPVLSHCVGNCEAAKCGPFGCGESELISDWREIHGVHVKGDDPIDSAEDTRANDFGRNGGMQSPTTACQVTCQQFRPAGLPSKY